MRAYRNAPRRPSLRTSSVCLLRRPAGACSLARSRRAFRSSRCGPRPKRDPAARGRTRPQRSKQATWNTRARLALPGSPTVGHGASRRLGLSSPDGAGVRAAAARQAFRATGPRVRASRARPDRLLPMAMTFALDWGRIILLSPHARLWLRRLHGRTSERRERIIDLGRAPTRSAAHAARNAWRRTRVPCPSWSLGRRTGRATSTAAR
jgi:hypothetical protein